MSQSPDTSIYQNIKPIGMPDPLQQAGKVLSLQQMVQQSKTEGLQQQNLQEQIQGRQQTNQRADRAAKALSKAYGALPPDADVDTKIQAGMTALQAEGLDKEAAEYGDTWAKYRESVSKQKAADRADHTAKLTDEAKQHELVGQSMGALLGLSPEDQYAAYAHYYPGAVEHGIFDANDPATPPPEQVNPETITPVLSGLQMRAITAQQQAEIGRQIVNDKVANRQKESEIKRTEAQTAEAETTRKKTQQELDEGLSPDERDFNKSLKDWLATNKLPDVPPNREKFRKVFKERQVKTTADDFDKRLALITKDPALYDKMFGRGTRGTITPQDVLRTRQQIMKEIKEDTATFNDPAAQEAAFEQERAAYKDQFKIDIGPFKSGAAAPPPAGATAPKSGAPVYKKGTSEIIGYFDGYDAQGKVKIRPKS